MLAAPGHDPGPLPWSSEFSSKPRSCSAPPKLTLPEATADPFVAAAVPGPCSHPLSLQIDWESPVSVQSAPVSTSPAPPAAFNATTKVSRSRRLERPGCPDRLERGNERNSSSSGDGPQKSQVLSVLIETPLAVEAAGEGGSASGDSPRFGGRRLAFRVVDEDKELPLIRRLFPWCRVWSFITLITAVQLVLFVITLIVAEQKFDGAFVSANPMGGPSAQALRYMGGIYKPSIRQGSLHLLLTPLLLHAGIIHLVFNVYFQTRLGYGLERRFGSLVLVVIYLYTGLFAVLLSATEKDSHISVGSSGALFGLMGADLVFVLYNRRQVMFWQLECVALVAIILINFLLGMFPGIDNFAHLGGLLAGLPLGIAITPEVEPKAHAVVWRSLSGLIALLMFVSLIITFIYVGLD